MAPVLGALVVSKHALAYAVFVLSTGEHATNSPADTFYPSNVEFLESCLTFFQVIGWSCCYRVTRQVVLKVLLTSKSRLCFSIDSVY